MSFNLFKSKDISTFVVFSLLVILCVAWLFLAQIQLEVKIVFIGLFFILGFIYNAWNKANRTNSQFTQKVRLLTEKVFEVKRDSKKKFTLSKWTKFLTEFLDELIGLDCLLLFVRNKKEFKPVFGYNLSKSVYKRLHFEINDKLISQLKSGASLTGQAIFKIESKGYDDLGKDFKKLIDEVGFNLLFQIEDESEIFALALIKAKRTALLDFEKNLILWVSKKVAKEFEIKKLKEEIKSKKRKIESYLSLEKWRKESSERELKKKIFDLYALFQETENLYNSLDEERLFFILIETLQKHFDSEKIMILLPEKDTGDLFPRYSRDIELENTSSVSLNKKSQFYFWIQSKTEPFFLKDVEKKEGYLLAFLERKGFVLGSKLNLPDSRFGVVLLGIKRKNREYQGIDLSSFSILLNMASLSLKNIKQYKMIEELSYTDSMTGLYNYRYFYKRLNEEIFRAKRFERKLALMMFDIDQFKIYNDSFGHQAGDSLLKQLGNHLLKVVRSIDVVCRYGGEEFCVIMPETDSAECRKFMERLRKSIEAFPFKDEYLDHTHHITISLGSAIYPRDAKDSDRLIWCADMALLKAKSEGKNRAMIYMTEKMAVKHP